MIYESLTFSFVFKGGLNGVGELTLRSHLDGQLRRSTKLFRSHSSRAEFHSHRQGLGILSSAYSSKSYPDAVYLPISMTCLPEKLESDGGRGEGVSTRTGVGLVDRE